MAYDLLIGIIGLGAGLAAIILVRDGQRLLQEREHARNR